MSEVSALISVGCLYKRSCLMWFGKFCFIFVTVFVLKIPLDYYVFNNGFGLEGLSWGLTLLTGWIFALMSFSGLCSYLLLIFMLSMLFMVFNILNVMTFYIFFELISVPMYLLILFNGYQPERLKSGLYMLLYTMSGSFPLFLGILSLNYLDYFYLCYMMCQIKYSVLFLVAFLVKLPVYSFHLWLPKAHVEAPVSGSMLLAGVLLKLGGYGMLHLMLFMNFWWEILMVVGLWGALISCFICLRETDLKKLVAYSSIHHSGFLLAGIASNSIWGINGALLMMLSHGVCSSGMFFMVNVLYERIHTRNLILVKGVLLLQPIFCFWWFITISASMGSPPFMGILSEIFLIGGTMSYFWALWPLICFILFFSVAYSIHLYSSISHGSFYSMSLPLMLVREHQVILSHILPAFLVIFKLNFFFI